MKAFTSLARALTAVVLVVSIFAPAAHAVAPALVEGTATGFKGIKLVKTYRATRMWAIGACTNFNVISKKKVPRYSKSETSVMNHKGVVAFSLPTYEERTKTSGTCAWKLETAYLLFEDKGGVTGSVSLYADGDTANRGPMLSAIRKVRCGVKASFDGLGLTCSAPADGIDKLSHLVYRDGDTNTVMQFVFAR